MCALSTRHYIFSDKRIIPTIRQVESTAEPEPYTAIPQDHRNTDARSCDTNIHHGNLRPLKTSTFTLTCDDGYIPVNKADVRAIYTCMDGQWKGDTPACRPSRHFLQLLYKTPITSGVYVYIYHICKLL